MHRVWSASTTSAAPFPPDGVRGARSYQLVIELTAPVRLRIGRLGRFDFPAGRYVYTGSARRNLAARVTRHLSKPKRLRWHVDYLLASGKARVTRVRLSRRAECTLNRATPGAVLVARFGASDCRACCGSHLKYLDPLPGARP
jgi:Uri superfamily endonuclease